MKKTKLLAYLLVVFCLCSCAHKSGHGSMQGVPPNTTGSHRPSSRQRPTAPPTQQPAPAPAPYIPPETVNDVPTVPNGGDDHNGKTKMDGQDIFKKYNSAVFMVLTPIAQGSGFFIDSNGLAVSNYHVFKGSNVQNVRIKIAGYSYRVSEVIRKSSDEDFILFRVEISNSNFIPIAKSKPSIGEKVYAIGSPKGMENTLSTGLVSQWRENNLMQISVPIDHGSSGGALINEYGEVVGITTLTFDEGSQANLNGAMSIDIIKPYINLR